MRQQTAAMTIILMALAIAGCSKPEAPAQSTTSPQPSAQAAPAPPLPAPAVTAVRPNRVFWGDEHVHTGWSADAGLASAVLTPEDAVRFARGEAVKSNTGQTAQMRRAYDWVAVTDHSDGMGTINEVRAGNAEFLADATAKRWYEMMNAGGAQSQAAQKEAVQAQARKTLPKVFMDPKWGVSAWEKTVDIMERYNAPGTFTAFIAYEWTSNGAIGENLHRNVIFRDGADRTRATPPLTTFVSAAPGRKPTDPESLWAWLADWEAKTGGRALAIPHNGNLSNGWMFREARYDGEDLTPEWAAARARWEPLVEIFQYKGSSEAHPALAMNDEFAGFEIWDTGDLAGNKKPDGAFSGEYARPALSTGLRLEATLGTNPFAFGMAGGTDTHTGIASTEEDNFWGKFAVNEPAPKRWEHISTTEPGSGYVRRGWTYAAGGLTAVWSHENTREALWDSMKRRETYATSGTRLTLRVFAGYEFSDADAQGDVAAAGYARGVPMGGTLAPAPTGTAPSFLIAALKDPEGANLDRVQVVKGWVDAEGASHEKVVDVLWSDGRTPGADGKLPPVGSTVDLATASYTNDIGATQLIGRFTDSDFDPAQRAWYYVRVIEIPTPRWTAYDAARFGDKMDAEVPMLVQERAVSSPIWYTPAG